MSDSENRERHHTAAAIAKDCTDYSEDPLTAAIYHCDDVNSPDHDRQEDVNSNRNLLHHQGTIDNELT